MFRIPTPDEYGPFKGCVAPFLVFWLCGWVCVEYLLWATMFGKDMHWAGGEVPPMWSLIILTAFWTIAGGAVFVTLFRMLRRGEGSPE